MAWVSPRPSVCRPPIYSLRQPSRFLHRPVPPSRLGRRAFGRSFARRRGAGENASATQHCVIGGRYAATSVIGILQETPPNPAGDASPRKMNANGYQIAHRTRGTRPDADRQSGVPHSGGDQLLAPPQRPDPVSAAGDLPAAQGSLSAGFRPDRPHHADLPVHRITAPAARGLFHRQAAAALFAGDRRWASRSSDC